MRVTVCVRRLANGELNPFDASAYEAALRLPAAEVTLLSMGPPPVKEFLEGLSRLGAARAVLLSDPAFAGADTLATAYTLSLALQRLAPELIVCGRQAIDGDTGQVGPELAELLRLPLVTGVMRLEGTEDGVAYATRTGETGVLTAPAVITLERICTLRLPSIRSRAKVAEVWDAAALGADTSRTGLAGSPTRVLESFENKQDRRKCRFIPLSELDTVLNEALHAPRVRSTQATSTQKLPRVWIVGEAPRAMAETVSDDITVLPLTDVEALVAEIRAGAPAAVLWGSDAESKRLAPQVAARLRTGLCADCTRLETDGETLFLYRPAFSGNIVAKIKCLTRPQMATVRTAEAGGARVAVGVGFGAKDCIPAAKAFAARLGAELVASRKAVDHDYMPYEAQVGLTGKSVSPDVYLAVGISGAVHHIAGMKGAGTVIAVNPDREADIFDYSDYGILATAEELFGR